MDDDHVLLGRLRSGDERAFEMLVDAYDGSLRRVARTYVRTPAAVILMRASRPVILCRPCWRGASMF